MNKNALIDKIAKDADLTKEAATAAVDSFIDGITIGLKQTEKVSLVGFGTWSVSHRAARTGRNPQTGEEIQIKAKNAIRFKPGKAFEEKFNG